MHIYIYTCTLYIMYYIYNLICIIYIYMYVYTCIHDIAVTPSSHSHIPKDPTTSTSPASPKLSFRDAPSCGASVQLRDQLGALGGDMT